MTTPPPLFPDLRLATVAGLLAEGAPAWRALGVERVRIFGSVARGEATAASDIDLLLDFAPGEEYGLLHLMRVKALLEDLLGRRVDVVTEASLRDPLRGEILADAVDVLEMPPVPQVTHREKRWRWRLFDLISALDRMMGATAPLTLTTFRRDEWIQDAVLLGLVRLGETTKYVPQSVQDRTPRIPWAYLRDIRNLIAHDYFSIDPALIWHTVRKELPALRPLLQALAEDGNFE